MLAAVTLSENDKKLLIAALIIVIILFLVLVLIGMSVHKVMELQGKAIDKEVSDGVRYRVLDSAAHFKKYGRIKNRRVFMKQSLWPILILLTSLLFYLIYAGVTGEWSRNYWGEFGSIFFLWDFGDEGSYVVFWGMRLLAKWPPLTNEPHIVPEAYASYILCSLWLIGSIYFLVVSQAFFSRAVMLNKRAGTVYNKSLEGFNYYDSIYPQNGVPNAVNPEAKKEESK